MRCLLLDLQNHHASILTDPQPTNIPIFRQYPVPHPLVVQLNILHGLAFSHVIRRVVEDSWFVVGDYNYQIGRVFSDTRDLTTPDPFIINTCILSNSLSHVDFAIFTIGSRSICIFIMYTACNGVKNEKKNSNRTIYAIYINYNVCYLLLSVVFILLQVWMRLLGKQLRLYGFQKCVWTVFLCYYDFFVLLDRYQY